MALGYSADAQHDYSAVINLTPNECVSDSDAQFKVCAEKFMLNGEDILPLLEDQQRRMLKETGVEVQVAENEKLISALEKRNAAQDLIIQQRQKTIDELTKLVAELAVVQGRSSV